MRAPTRRSVVGALWGIGRPSSDHDPAVGDTKPKRIRIVVVLPEPFGPRNPNTLPAGTARFTPSSTLARPKRLDSPSVAMASGSTTGGSRDQAPLAAASSAEGVTSPATTLPSGNTSALTSGVRSSRAVPKLPWTVVLAE